MTYTLSPVPMMVVRDADQAHIPFDPDNMDYQKYLAWLDAGNTPNPAPPSPSYSSPMPTADQRLDAGIQAATETMAQPVMMQAASGGPPASQADLDKVQGQLDQLQLAMKEMLSAQSTHITPHAPAPAPASLRLAPTVVSDVFSPPPEPAPVIVTPTPSPPPSTLEPQPVPAPVRGGLAGI